MSESGDALDTLGLSPEIKRCLRDIREHLEDTYRASIERLTAQTTELRVKLVELTTTLESERNLVAQLAEEGQGLAAERDVLCQRVAVLERRGAGTVIAKARAVRDENVKWDEAEEGDCFGNNMPNELVEACIDLCVAVDELDAHERKASGQ